MKSLAELLREAREKRGWTLEYAAYKLCVSPILLNCLEIAAIKNPHFRFVISVKRVYRISFKALTEAVEAA